MRTPLLFALAILAGCASEHALTPLCERDGEYLACHAPVTEYEAREGCERAGMLLARVDTWEAQQRAAQVMSGSAPWWVDSDRYICAQQGSPGGHSPSGCFAERPYLCR